MVLQSLSQDGLPIPWLSDGEVKIAKINHIEVHLTTFECMMAVYKVRRSQWVHKISPQLTGKAQLAFAAIDVTVMVQYDKVKAAILRRYDISNKTYRQRFQAATIIDVTVMA